MGTRTIIPGSNNAGQIGSESKYWNKGYFNELHTNTLYTSATGLTADTIKITSGSITFEGTNVDDHETTLAVTNPTADRTITFPDATGTVALTSDVPAAYTLPLATTSVRGGVELGSDTDLTETYETGGTGTSGRTYPVQLNSDNQMGVSVPWTDTNTTYSAGTGIDLSTTTFNLDLTEVITADGANRVLTSDGDGTLTAESGFTATSSTIEFEGNMFRIGDSSGSGATFQHHSASGASHNGGSLTIEAGSPQIGVAVNKNAGTLILKSGMSTGTGDAGIVEIWTGKEFGSTSGTAFSQERVADFTNPSGTATFRITDDDDDFCKIAVDTNTTISTASSGGAGNLFFDVQGSIVLDSDVGTIDFKDDGVFLARLSATGLSFNTNTGAGIQFEGATSNNFETSLNVVDPTDDRTINLPDASGTVALTNKHIVVIRAAFHASSTSGYYLTIGGGTTGESSNLASFSYTSVFNCPYDGQVLRAAASTQSTGSKTVKLEMYINKDDSDLVADQRGSDWNVSSYTNSWCDDSPGDWTFSKGENIAIRATDSSAVFGTQYTIVLEFDLTT